MAYNFRLPSICCPKNKQQTVNQSSETANGTEPTPKSTSSGESAGPTEPQATAAANLILPPFDNELPHDTRCH
ncbi:MAG: hypothetical protein AAGI66_06855 [Cyanobacteria bacterium P01_H01_bin.74]